ncbi:MAG: hypothetical protein V3U74_05520 [Thermodesulfobacteriota bacterium]
MSFLRNKYVRVLLITAAALLSTAVVTVAVVTRVVVPREVHRYLEELSEDTGIRIDLNDISYDIVRGLKGRGFSVSDLTDMANPFFTVRNLVIKHDIFSPLLGATIKIRGRIEAPSIELSSAGIEKLSELIDRGRKQMGADDGKKKGKFTVEMESLEIIDAEIRLPSEKSVFLQKIMVRFGEKNVENQKTIKIEVFTRIENNAASAFGEILLGDPVSTVRVRVSVPAPDLKFISPLLELKEQTTINLNVELIIDDGVRASGVITLGSTGGLKTTELPPAVRIDFDAGSNRALQNLVLSGLDVYVNGFSALTLTGTVEGALSKRRSFDIRGKGASFGIEGISGLFAALSSVELRGRVTASEISLTGSPAGEGLKMEVDVGLDGVEAAHKQGKFRLRGLGGNLRFNKTVYSDRGDVTSLRGELAIEGIDAVYGGLRDLRVGIEMEGGRGSEGKLKLLLTRASYSGGAVSGELNLVLKGGDEFFSGSFRGSDIDLSGVNFVNAAGAALSLDGRVDTIEGKFNALRGSGLRVDAKLDLTGFGASYRGREILRSSSIGVDKELTVIYSASGKDKFSVESSGVVFSDLLYGELFYVKRGRGKGKFSFRSAGDWTLEVGSTGEGGLIRALGLILGEFELDLSRGVHENGVMVGTVKGRDGMFLGRSIATYSTGFGYRDRELRLEGLRLGVAGLGEGELKKLRLKFGEDETYSADADGGEFSLFGGRLSLRGVSGEVGFTGSGRGLKWKGMVKARGGDVLGAGIKDLTLRTGGGWDDFYIEDIKVTVAEGSLGGSLMVKRGASGRRVKVEFQHSGGRIPLGDSVFALGGAALSLDGVFFGGGTGVPEGKLKLYIRDLTALADGDSQPVFTGGVHMSGSGETMRLEGWLLDSATRKGLRMTGALDKNGRLSVKVPEFDVESVGGVLSPVISKFVGRAELHGGVGMEIEVENFPSDNAAINGSLSLREFSLSGTVLGTELSISNANGEVFLRSVRETGGAISSLSTGAFRGDKKSFKKFMKAQKSKDGRRLRAQALSVDRLEYGFVRLDDIEVLIEAGTEGISIADLRSKFNDGDVYCDGTLRFDGAKSGLMLGLLMSDISLLSFTTSLGLEDYVSGRVNGLVSLRGEATGLDAVDGSFSFWAIKSPKEPRWVGKAFLKKLGMKEKLFLRSSRKFNKGEVHGTITDGIITFGKFDISHRIFGLITDFRIQVDPKGNLVSIGHLLSVIKETAKRIREGGLEIEYKK